MPICLGTGLLSSGAEGGQGLKQVCSQAGTQILAHLSCLMLLKSVRECCVPSALVKPQP